MNMKLTSLCAILIVTLLLQGCIVARVATAPLRYAVHRGAIARAEKRGERRAEKRIEKEAEARPAPPSHIERPDAPPPEAPAN